MEVKTMYAVEHYYKSDERTTYEIFETLTDAESFIQDPSNWDENHLPLFIFKADFNTELIFQEENGNWNYDDYLQTIVQHHSFKRILNNIN